MPLKQYVIQVRFGVMYLSLVSVFPVPVYFYLHLSVVVILVRCTYSQTVLVEQA